MAVESQRRLKDNSLKKEAFDLDLERPDAFLWVKNVTGGGSSVGVITGNTSYRRKNSEDTELESSAWGPFSDVVCLKCQRQTMNCYEFGLYSLNLVHSLQGGRGRTA